MKVKPRLTPEDFVPHSLYTLWKRELLWTKIDTANHHYPRCQACGCLPDGKPTVVELHQFHIVTPLPVGKATSIIAAGQCPHCEVVYWYPLGVAASSLTEEEWHAVKDQQEEALNNTVREQMKENQ